MGEARSREQGRGGTLEPLWLRGRGSGSRVAVHKLVLCPAHIDQPAVGTAALVARLQDIGLLAAPVCHHPSSGYRAGVHFLQLVSFLGCSPAIELEPPLDPEECERACASGKLVHVRFPAAGQNIRFRGDGRLPAPRCPQCRKSEEHWPELLARWRTNPRKSGWECRACGHHGRLFDLNFRQRGAFGRCFVDIWGVHPAEAVPDDALLSSLRELSGGDWKYLYLQD
jgi:Zn ribbon nucleic-acid-binding protein